MFLFEKNRHPSVETKPDPRSIEGLIAWLETMPSDITFNHMSSRDCLLCRYASHVLGRTVWFTEAWRFLENEKAGPFSTVAYGYTQNDKTYSYADVLRRARAYQAKVRT